MSLNKIINLGSRQTLVNSTLAIIAAAAALVLSLTVLANVGHANVPYTLSADGLTYTFEAKERVSGSGTPEPTNWESLIVEDKSACKTDAALEAAKADPGAYQYEENPENPSTTYTRTIEAEDDGKVLCVYSVFDGNPADEPSAGKSSGGFPINLASATTTPDATTGGAPGYDDPNAGSKPTEITGAGPQDDFLLGSLLIVGVVASISCAKIWRNYYKLQTSK